MWTFQGWETAEARAELGLKKRNDKSKQVFESHAVDAFALCALVVGTQKPTTRALYYLKQIKLHRRQLHRFKFRKGGKRPSYGGTRSLGLKRRTLAQYPKYGLASVGGIGNGSVSLPDYDTNKRLCRNAKTEECEIRNWTPFRSYLA